METTDLTPLLEDLTGHIDDLESALSPLINSSLSSISSRLPLLDKAKLHILTTYAIESILFSALKLNGVDARNHAVFTELSRVKQYFDKIKEAEAKPQQPTVTLNKEAAGRFIKYGLSGNEKYDRERVQKQEKEREVAEQQFVEASSTIGTAGRFRHVGKRKAGDAEEEDLVKGEDIEDVQRPMPSSDNKRAKQEEQQEEKQEISAEKAERKKEKQKRDKGRREKDVKKMKAHTAPRAGSTVFQDLLSRSEKGKK